MRSAPPMVPGMPKKNSSPLTLAAAAVSARACRAQPRRR